MLSPSIPEYVLSLLYILKDAFTFFRLQALMRATTFPIGKGLIFSSQISGISETKTAYVCSGVLIEVTAMYLLSPSNSQISLVPKPGF